MLRTVPNNRGFTASLLALSLVTLLSLFGCGGDSATAPETGPTTRDDAFNRDDERKTPRDDNRIEDGR